jgi:hypothetical protein
MSAAVTKTDRNAIEWGIRDGAIRLRRWGGDQVHPLPPPPSPGCKIGSGESCTIRITDPLVSREHALLTHHHERWFVSDLGSKNGLWYDGGRRKVFVLVPGLEIMLGTTTLIAESPRSIALHGFLARMLGFASGQRDAVDHALRSIRMAAMRRAELTLTGDVDLVPIAHALHRHTLGADRPFIVCDPRRRDTEESVRTASNQPSGLAGLQAATGGSLCVHRARLPPDFATVLDRLCEPDTRVQLFVCSQGRRACEPSLVVPIHVPQLCDRRPELPRIVDEYALDAATALGAPPVLFTSDDRAWVLKHAASSLPEIEKATLRLTACKVSGSLNEAAARLGMAAVSLTRWLRRRAPPKGFAP